MDSYEAEELGRYTSLSALAICAFLLGLLSIVALLAPTLVVVPIAGIVVALIALVRISGSAGALSGRNLALCGLALSVLCGFASPLRTKVRDGLYSRQADEAARAWLGLIAEDQTEAALSQLTGKAKSGLMGPPPSEGPPPAPNPQIEAAKFKQNELATKLREEAQHGELEFANRALACDASTAIPRIAATYQTVKPDDSLTMNVVLLRSSEGKWFIDSWNLAGEAAHNHSHPH